MDGLKGNLVHCLHQKRGEEGIKKSVRQTNRLSIVRISSY